MNSWNAWGGHGTSLSCCSPPSSTFPFPGFLVLSWRWNRKRTLRPAIDVGPQVAWRFWPLVHLVTYGVIPSRHRVLWVNMVDLVWSSLLSGMTNSKDAGAGAAEGTSSSADADPSELSETGSGLQDSVPLVNGRSQPGDPVAVALPEEDFSVETTPGTPKSQGDSTGELRTTPLGGLGLTTSPARRDSEGA